MNPQNPNSKKPPSLQKKSEKSQKRLSSKKKIKDSSQMNQILSKERLRRLSKTNLISRPRNSNRTLLFPQVLTSLTTTLKMMMNSKDSPEWPSNEEILPQITQNWNEKSQTKNEERTVLRMKWNRTQTYSPNYFSTNSIADLQKHRSLSLTLTFESLNIKVLICLIS